MYWPCSLRVARLFDESFRTRFARPSPRPLSEGIGDGADRSLLSRATIADRRGTLRPVSEANTMPGLTLNRAAKAFLDSPSC